MPVPGKHQELQLLRRAEGREPLRAGRAERRPDHGQRDQGDERGRVRVEGEGGVAEGHVDVQEVHAVEQPGCAGVRGVRLAVCFRYEQQPRA